MIILVSVKFSQIICYSAYACVCCKGRLETYMKQNHENVERAEAEFNTLHEDMEQTLELQRRLAQRYLQLRIY